MTENQYNALYFLKKLHSQSAVHAHPLGTKILIHGNTLRSLEAKGWIEHYSVAKEDGSKSMWVSFPTDKGLVALQQYMEDHS